MARKMLARLALSLAIALGALGCGYEEASDTGTTVDPAEQDGADADH